MKYIPGYSELKRLNRAAIREKRNRSITEEGLDAAKGDETTRYPIILVFPHNDIEMRCEVILNASGERVFLDMSLQEFDNLPETEVTDVPV